MKNPSKYQIIMMEAKALEELSKKEVLPKYEYQAEVDVRRAREPAKASPERNLAEESKYQNHYCNPCLWDSRKEIVA